MKFWMAILTILATGLGATPRSVLADELRQLTPPKVGSSDADQNPVEPSNIRGAYASGMIYARATRSKPATGIIFKTDEVHLIVGNFQDDNKYSGNTKNVSTKSRTVFNQINKLDPDKPTFR